MQVEGAGVVPVEEVEREVGLDVGFEAFDFAAGAVDDELGVAVGPTASGNGGPIAEARLRDLVVAHVPLAAHAEGVAVGGEDLGVRAKTLEPGGAGWAGGVLGEQIVLDVMVRREAAGHVGHAAGRADGGGGEGVGEPGAGFGEGVDARRVDGRTAVGAGSPGAVVVGHEEDDVGASGSGRR